MNSAPQLLREDRPEFERVLDQALRTAAVAGAGRRLTAEQLRTMALGAAIPIAACAAVEYQRFVALREQLRHPSNAPSATYGPAAAPGPAAGGEDGDGQAARTGETGPPGETGRTGEAGQRDGAGLGIGEAMGAGLADAAGAGLLAIVSVLAPLLAGTAAVIFLLVGYALHVLSPEPALAEGMRNAGWAFTALAAATALLGMGGVLLTAVRNGSRGAVAPPGGSALAEEVAQARAAWREALLERGILPFLREALADPRDGPAPERPAPLVRDEHRTPRLGYSHPGFSSPAAGGGETATRPRFGSPDYSSPEYGGPDRAE
ncbi:hypothetical protein [Streptomyces sp. JJ36]|uniref:hypothetical protein n=1 Tax=Streptomyces sp. JJ36 TaxID=2736645 RepID=UPI001F2A9D47|nr:hypothetical protein [Streptomyces sp. JJ36]MCF6522154.1 hypothetical protein [Streptomyces sp. JJ36]